MATSSSQRGGSGSSTSASTYLPSYGTSSTSSRVSERIGIVHEASTHDLVTSHDELLRDLCREVMDDHNPNTDHHLMPPSTTITTTTAATTTNFEVPTLPSGKVLKLVILSTWGDPHYVGLAGMEVFDGNGELVVIQDAGRQVVVVPEVVPSGHGIDPRTVDKIFDGMNLTRDDLHVWLAPYDKREKEHSITVSW